MVIRLICIATLAGCLLKAESAPPERRDGDSNTLVFDGYSTRLVVDTRGGAISEFRIKSSEINPLNWNVPQTADFKPHAFGHFLCLDRWGPPSDAEGKRGMPYHGEASNVRWSIEESPTRTNGMIEGIMSAKLPLAGLSIRRTIKLSYPNWLFTVREDVRNERDLGRIFNMVQHATIAPPFLDENTIVSCNGVKGFAQGGTLPNPEEPLSEWPNALKKDGTVVDLRHLTDDPEPNFVSYAIDEPYGWVTAANPSKGWLIGYIWRTQDYPWVSLWRDVHDGKPAARGLEFGSTGLHQPFPILVKKGKIMDRQLFEYIDAGQTITKRYTGFLVGIPHDFSGVSSAVVDGEFLHLHEKTGPVTTRDFIISLRGAEFE
jgi:hypothetical protein